MFFAVCGISKIHCYQRISYFTCSIQMNIRVTLTLVLKSDIPPFHLFEIYLRFRGLGRRFSAFYLLHLFYIKYSNKDVYYALFQSKILTFDYHLLWLTILLSFNNQPWICRKVFITSTSTVALRKETFWFYQSLNISKLVFYAQKTIEY